VVAASVHAPARRSTDWREDAVCFGLYDEVDFFPRRGDPAIEARQTCWQCPVRWECLAHALGREHIGVWGGTTERQRRRLRKLPDWDAVVLRVLTEDTRLRQRLDVGYGPLPQM